MNLYNWMCWWNYVTVVGVCIYLVFNMNIAYENEGIHNAHKDSTDLLY